MSNGNNPLRTREQLSNEYMHLLAQAGERFYQMDKVKQGIKDLFIQIDALQAEAALVAATENTVSETIPTNNTENVSVVNG